MLEPKECPDMPTLRSQIDALDRDLVGLLKRRAGYIDRAIEIKTGNGLPARIPDRVEQVVSFVRQEAASQDLDSDLVETLWRQLIDWSIDREARQIDRDT